MRLPVCAAVVQFEAALKGYGFSRAVGIAFLLRLYRLLKNSGIGPEREGHEFHSCRKSSRINGGFQPLGEG